MKNIDIQVGQDANGYSGLLYRNKPTPSGCDRYILWLSDNRRFKDADTALEEFKKIPTIAEIIEKDRL